MSCDFAVWYPDKNITNDAAGKRYEELCNGNYEVVIPHPSVEAFYNEITSLHPEIGNVAEDEIDNTDLCPWSIAFDKSPGHIIMSCVWSKADYVEILIRNLAKKHSLAVFDPQSGRVFLPYEDSTGIDLSRDIVIPENEKIHFNVSANLFRGKEAVGGKLIITDIRLIFKSHAFNFQTGITEIPFEEVLEAFKRNTLGFIPNGILVVTKGKREYNFVVWRRNKLIDFINEKVSSRE